MKRADIIKRDNLLADYIFAHKGQENAVTRKQCAEYLTANGYPTDPESAHQAVAKIAKERHLPICSLNKRGYFWAKSREDIIVCVTFLQKRIHTLDDHIQRLKAFMLD